MQAVLDGVYSVYQPIVELATAETVAYEALARGPEGPLSRPDVLFDAAREQGWLAALDARCRAVAIAGSEGLGASLFINVEPSVLHQITDHDPGRSLVYEITERDLATDPAALVFTLDRLRDQGAIIALDDVGVDWRSLALLPVISPDIVKLDMSLIQRPLDVQSALVIQAVRAHCEYSQALVIAEGIETDVHLHRARIFGATHGQGWMFGRPAPLDTRNGKPLRATKPLPPTPHTPATGLLTDLIGTKRELLGYSRALETQAQAQHQPSLVLACFQHARFFEHERQRYEQLSRTAAFVGAFGIDIPLVPAAGIRGARLRDNEALAGEWNLVVLSPHYAGALVSRQTPSGFAFALSFERERVATYARSLLLRMAALDS